MSLASVSIAGADPALQLHFSFSRFGRTVCAESKVLRGPASYLLCEREVDGKRISLKASAQLEARKTVLVTTIIEEVAADGAITVLGAPSVRTMLGSEAKITESDDRGEVLSFGVLPELE